MTTAGDIACIEVVEVITDYLEGTLPESERALFEAHLQVCTGCTAYLQQMRTTIGSLRTLCVDDSREEHRTELFRLFRDWKSGRL